MLGGVWCAGGGVGWGGVCGGGGVGGAHMRVCAGGAAGHKMRAQSSLVMRHITVPVTCIAVVTPPHATHVAPAGAHTRAHTHTCTTHIKTAPRATSGANATTSVTEHTPRVARAVGARKRWGCAAHGTHGSPDTTGSTPITCKSVTFALTPRGGVNHHVPANDVGDTTCNSRR